MCFSVLLYRSILLYREYEARANARACAGAGGRDTSRFLIAVERNGDNALEFDNPNYDTIHRYRLTMQHTAILLSFITYT